MTQPSESPGKDDRLRAERTWSENAASHELSAEDYAAWTLMRSTHRIAAQEGTTLVAWKRFADGPTIVNRFAVLSLTVSLAKGLIAVVVDEDGHLATISHTPRQICPGVFIWIPYFSDLRYLPTGNKFGARFSLVFRMRANPDTQIENVAYLSESQDFYKLWPKERI